MQVKKEDFQSEVLFFRVKDGPKLRLGAVFF